MITQNSFLKLQRHRVVLITILIIILLIGLFGEKVAFGNGYGWDGRLYNKMVNSFSDLYFNRGIDKYHMYRILPFAFLHFIYKIFNVAQSPETTVYGCWVMNFLFIIGSVYYYFKISNKIGLKRNTEIIGFCLYFFNYPILKFMGYCPVMCDTFAYLLATAAIYYFISDKKVALAIVGVISLLSWPLQGGICWILLFIPRTSIINYTGVNVQEQKKIDKWFSKIITLSYVLWLPILFAIYYWFIVYHLKTDLYSFLYARRAPTSDTIMILSVLSVSVFYYIVFRKMDINWLAQIKEIFKAKTLIKIIVSFIIFCVIYWLVGYYGGKEGFSYKGVILNYVAQPTSDLFIFLETPFIYLALFPIFVVVYWKGIREMICQRLGFSYFLVILLSLIMIMGIETRCLISFYPIYLIPLLLVINNFDFKKEFVFAILIISLILSFFWFSINVPGISEAFNKHFSTYQYFPAQRYYMFMGPWQGHDVYYIAFAVEIFLLGLLYFAHKKKWIYKTL